MIHTRGGELIHTGGRVLIHTGRRGDDRAAKKFYEDPLDTVNSCVNKCEAPHEGKGARRQKLDAENKVPKQREESGMLLSWRLSPAHS